jgi:hypothetical protein
MSHIAYEEGTHTDENRIAAAINLEWKTAQMWNRDEDWKRVYDALQGMWSLALFADLRELEELAQFLQDIANVRRWDMLTEM